LHIDVFAATWSPGLRLVPRLIIWAVVAQPSGQVLVGVGSAGLAAVLVFFVAVPFTGVVTRIVVSTVAPPLIVSHVVALHLLPPCTELGTRNAEGSVAHPQRDEEQGACRRQEMRCEKLCSYPCQPGWPTFSFKARDAS